MGPKTYRNKKRKFYGNRFTKECDSNSESKPTASSSKLKEKIVKVSDDHLSSSNLRGNRIISIEFLISLLCNLSCSACLHQSLVLQEDSTYGLLSNFSVKCENCSYVIPFTTSKKIDKCSELNTLLVYGLRLIGKGYTSGKKLFSILNLPFLAPYSFQKQVKKLADVAKKLSRISMSNAANEIISLKKSDGNDISCGVSVDGTWQRRGYSSLNGCVSAISVDSGKILDCEVMSSYCRQCSISSRNTSTTPHVCRNHTGSAGSMECTGAERIFKRSLSLNKLKYLEYYGDGDAKGYETVRNVYGKKIVYVNMSV